MQADKEKKPLLQGAPRAGPGLNSRDGKNAGKDVNVFDRDLF